MSTWYMTSRFSIRIEPVEVIRETAKQLVIRKKSFHWQTRAEMFHDRKHAKEGPFETFHPTWEAAHAHLMKRCEDRVAGLRAQLQAATGDLGNVKGMKPPVSEVA